MKRIALAWVGACASFSALLLTGSLGAAPAPAIGSAADWHGVNGDSDETGFSRLDAISAGNARQLGLAWSLELPGEASLLAAPVVVDGTLYFTGSFGDVYAVDGTTGAVRWKFEPKVWDHNPGKMNYSFGANRGVAYDNGKIFSAALDGRLFALDALTGQKLWEAETTNPKGGQTITGAPRAFQGKVIIGQGGADFGQRGYVSAWDQTSGAMVWKFYVVPASPEANKGDAAMEAAAKTWNGPFWKTNGGGGGPWDSMTFDAELGRVYVGTANAYEYDPEKRSPGGGDNLYTASIVALDANTGKYVWHYQVNPRDSWDYDATQQMTLATLNIAGAPRKVLMQAPKNGFFYVLDRNDGKLISAGQIAKQNWAERIDIASGRPVERKGIRYESGSSVIYPNGTGAHSWMRMAYSPKTGLVYVPTMQAGVRWFKGEPAADELKVSGLVVGNVKPEPGDGTGTLVAWDPVAQKARWQVHHASFFNGGTAVTAGDVVFQGTADGWFHAYNAATGAELWKNYVGMGVIAAPTVWSRGGKQYVSVLAGYGGSVAAVGGAALAGWKYAMPRRLVTYTLGAKAVMKDLPRPTMKVAVVDNPKEVLDPKAITMGRNLWLACGACHGKAAIGAGGPAPDLRESAIPLDPDAFYGVVHDGALIQRGMPGYALFGKPVIDGLRQYIRAQARLELERQKKPGQK